MTADDPTKESPELTKTVTSIEKSTSKLHYQQYTPESEAKYLPAIRRLISSDLSEPYSIYVYRYFLYQWGDLCFLVSHSYHAPTRMHTVE